MFNNTSQEIPNIAAELKFPAIPRPGVRAEGGSHKEEQHIGPVTYKYEFLNYFGRPVTVVDRNGFRHTLPAKVDHRYKQCFIIRLRVEYSRAAWSDMDSLLIGLPTDKYSVLNGCKEHWERLRLTTPFGHYGREPTKTITLDFIVEADMLFDKKSVYVRQADIVVSLLDLLQAPPHPAHPDAVRVARLPNQTSTSLETSVQYELIEDTTSLAPRYVFVSGRVFTILPKKDSRRAQGLYVTYVDKDVDDPENPRTSQEKYPLEDIESLLGIFRTAEEAEAAGDLKTTRRSELAAMEHNTAVLRKQLDETKVEQEKVQRLHEETLRNNEHSRKVELFTLQAKIHDLERSTKIAQELAEQEKFRAVQETARIKEESERRLAEMNERSMMQKAFLEERSNARKDVYEDRTYTRKDYYDDRSKERSDSSEMVKFLPAIVLGIGALVIAGLKLLAGK